MLKKGFTLAELLIIIAIIAVLVAIAIPVFNKQLERSREAVDLANVRSGYAEVIIEITSNPQDYSIIIPLKQSIDDWQMSIDRLSIGGLTPDNPNWIGIPRAHGSCKIEYKLENNSIIINWNGAGDINYIKAVAPYQNQSLMDLKQQNNDARVAADQATLKAIGQAILNKNWSITELKNNLGILSQGNTVRIADYYQDKKGSYDEGAQYSSDGFRLTSTAQLRNVLTDIGYNGGRTSMTSSGDMVYENLLFYSDELASNKFHNYPIEQTKRSIIIDNIKTENGKIVSFNIYSKAMDDQANLNNQEKAKFNIKIS